MIIVNEREVNKMKKRMKKDKWEKTMILENREFRIKFWYDYCVGIPLFYTSIEEKVLVEPSLFNRKGYIFSTVVSDYWIDETEQNPIELALTKIKQCLQNEKELNKLEEMLDRFCQA
jgi:hypothetical protein